MNLRINIKLLALSATLLTLPMANAARLETVEKGGLSAPRPPLQTPSASQPQIQNSLTGTYREKTNRESEIGRRALAATSHLESDEQQKQGRALMRILRAPGLFAIEQYGTTFTMNYPDGTRVGYEADGKPRVFRATGGETIRIEAELDGTRLNVDLTWSGGERLQMTFERIADTGRLVYTRSAVNRSLSAPVSITSEYEKISPRATRSFTGLVAR